VTLPANKDAKTTTFFNASIQMVLGDGKSSSSGLTHGCRVSDWQTWLWT
jgi:hypothetical protein